MLCKGPELCDAKRYLHITRGWCLRCHCNVQPASINIVWKQYMAQMVCLCAARQTVYGSDFATIVSNVTGSSSDGWSREKTHASRVCTHNNMLSQNAVTNLSISTCTSDRDTSLNMKRNGCRRELGVLSPVRLCL